MIYKNLLLLFILIYAAKSLAQATPCTIKTADKIYYVNKELVTFSQVIQASDCPQATQEAFTKELLDLTGSIPVSHFRDSFAHVTIEPSRIAIDSLDSLIKSKLTLEPGYVVEQFRSSQRNTFLLSESQSINFQLTNSALGPCSLTVEIVDALTNGREKVWLTAYVKTKIYALVAKRSLDRTHGALRIADFEKKMITTDAPDKLFIQEDRLGHFALNKNITVGHLLQRTDIQSIPLVQYGVPAHVQLSHNGISLSGSALPMRTAGFGEFIQLKNSKTNKLITAKVVDYNKVQIEL